MLARGANPLSGLPGNESIQREISHRISKNMHFDVSYIDIDNFKPYNDYYGFERGDHVIKTLANTIRKIVQSLTHDDFSFTGHIGGDDFILITRPQISIPWCEQIIFQFDAFLEEFHGREDFRRKFYVSKTRDGKEEPFDLLSLSIGIVSTEVYKIDSYAQLASVASEVKKAAKMQKGSSIVRDRRMM
jgi:GGDEF domain-containing protein